MSIVLDAITPDAVALLAPFVLPFKHSGAVEYVRDAIPGARQVGFPSKHGARLALSAIIPGFDVHVIEEQHGQWSAIVLSTEPLFGAHGRISFVPPVEIEGSLMMVCATIRYWTGHPTANIPAKINDTEDDKTTETT